MPHREHLYFFVSSFLNGSSHFDRDDCRRAITFCCMLTLGLRKGNVPGELTKGFFLGLVASKYSSQFFVEAGEGRFDARAAPTWLLLEGIQVFKGMDILQCHEDKNSRPQAQKFFEFISCSYLRWRGQIRRRLPSKLQGGLLLPCLEGIRRFEVSLSILQRLE